MICLTHDTKDCTSVVHVSMRSPDFSELSVMIISHVTATIQAYIVLTKACYPVPSHGSSSPSNASQVLHSRWGWPEMLDVGYQEKTGNQHLAWLLLEQFAHHTTPLNTLLWTIPDMIIYDPCSLNFLDVPFPTSSKLEQIYFILIFQNTQYFNNNIYIYMYTHIIYIYTQLYTVYIHSIFLNTKGEMSRDWCLRDCNEGWQETSDWTHRMFSKYPPYMHYAYYICI